MIAHTQLFEQHHLSDHTGSHYLAVIMAGGRGTRIATIYPDLPKPLIPLDGIPVLERGLNSLRDQGVKSVLITVSHLAEQIISYFGNGSGISPATGEPFGINITFFLEKIPLGNAGALLYLRPYLAEEFLLLNADSLFELDINRLLNFHRSRSSLATILTHPNSHPYDSGLIIADAENKVTQWLTKEGPRPRYYHNLVNAGVHVLSVSLIDEYLTAHPNCLNGTQLTVSANTFTASVQHPDSVVDPVDLDRDLLRPLAGSGQLISYRSPEYIKDMGTPERLKAVERDVKAGIPKRRSLCNRQRAVFLDRDGTVIRYVPFLKDIEKLELLPGAADAVRLLNDSGYLVIIVTNQPVIARGELSFEGLDLIHQKLETLLDHASAYLDGIYFCPHHPDKGFPGEIPELKIACHCRKPAPGLLLKAAQDFNLDLKQCWMVGDSPSDITAGHTVSCRTILVPRNGVLSSEIQNYSQDYFCSDLTKATRLILSFMDCAP
ncbi:MAG: HAD-IIIA family hydrolase [Succinivibrio sp.]|nr:HAD-IIIA family hydrolase [Succinivibrio sp.]